MFRVFRFLCLFFFVFSSVGDSLSDLGELGGNLFLFVFRVFSWEEMCVCLCLGLFRFLFLGFLFF